MGGTKLSRRLAEKGDDEKGQIPQRQGAARLNETAWANVLTKIEQSPWGECQNSEYLTLLSSFPDVKKSD
jgi:hypothetical protein